MRASRLLSGPEEKRIINIIFLSIACVLVLATKLVLAEIVSLCLYLSL